MKPPAEGDPSTATVALVPTSGALPNTSALADNRSGMLSRFADRTPGFFWAWSRQSPDRVQCVNAAFESTWGISAAAMQAEARSWVDVVHVEDRAAVVRAFDQWLDDPQNHAFDIEHRVVRADGGLGWVHVRGHASTDGASSDCWMVTGEDVTERRLAADALGELRQRLRALEAISSSAFVSYRQTPHGEVSLLRGVEHLARVYGLQEQSLAIDASPLLDRVHPDDQPAMRAELAESARTLSPLKMRFRVCLPNSDVRHLETQSMPVRHVDGSLVWHGTVSDRTEHELESREARRAAAHYRAIFSLLPEGIVVCDLQGRVITCNATAARSAGVTEEQWRGKSALSPGWTRTDTVGRPMAFSDTPTGRVMAGGPAEHGVLTGAHGPNGQHFWLEVGAIPLHDPDDDTLVAVAAVFADVTQRKQQEDELIAHRQNLEKLVAERTRELEGANADLRGLERFTRTVTDNLIGPVSYWDAGQRCRFANRSFLAWARLTTEQVLGRHAEEIFVGELQRETLSRLAVALQGQAQQYEQSGPDGAGKLIVYQVHLVPDLVDGSSAQGVYAMAYDVTGLKAAEAELRLASAAAAAANTAKSAFLANMSHEIRTPMNAIIGLTHLMARDNRDSTQRGRLSKVDAAAKHLLQVINDILDLSKIEAGKMSLEMAEFSLDSVLSRTFEIVSERAREKGLELVLDTDHIPDRMRGDSTRLQQVLLNLLANAVKFTERGWVRVRGELLHQDRTRVQVRFEVKDTGEGISPQAQKHLFSAFEQADNSITRRHGGTGLGLALTRHLVVLMGGEVGVLSTLGEGSTFWFTAWLEAAEEAGEQAAPLPIEGLRVLVVDDLPESLASLGDRLRMMGLRVQTATSGAVALDQVEAAMSAGTPYDLLLIDWRMPLMDGVETLRRLRRALQTGMPACILMSAFDEPAMWQEARGVGFDAVLVKPITSSALHDTLMRVFRRQGTLSPTLSGESGAAETMLRLHHAGQRVLLAEDNPVNQEVAEELLRSAGLVVDVAGDGERAVELASCRHYDAVLMDMQMPVMDGKAATRAIRQQVGSGLPIIAMTANAFVEDRTACLEAGMNDHIAKPVDPAHMYLTLLRWLPVRSQTASAGVPADTALPLERVASREQMLLQAGIDLERAMQSVNGQRALFDRALARFAATYATGVPDLVLAARSGNLSTCQQHCHSLRGACHAIGAEAMAMRIAVVEQALASGEEGTAAATLAESLNETLITLTRAVAASLA